WPERRLRGPGMGPPRQRVLPFGVTNPSRRSRKRRALGLSVRSWRFGVYADSGAGLGSAALPLPEGLILSGSGGTLWLSAPFMRSTSTLALSPTRAAPLSAAQRAARRDTGAVLPGRATFN